MLVSENVLSDKEKLMSDGSVLCFECLGEAAWCSACKKTIIPPSEKEDCQAEQAEQQAASDSNPDQLPLL